MRSFAVFRNSRTLVNSSEGKLHFWTRNRDDARRLNALMIPRGTLIFPMTLYTPNILMHDEVGAQGVDVLVDEGRLARVG